MTKSERAREIESYKDKANDRYGVDGWASVYVSFTLSDGTSETVRIVNPNRRRGDDEPTSNQAF